MAISMESGAPLQEARRPHDGYVVGRMRVRKDGEWVDAGGYVLTFPVGAVAHGGCPEYRPPRYHAGHMWHWAGDEWVVGEEVLCPTPEQVAHDPPGFWIGEAGSYVRA